MRETIFINVLGAPGTGKTTISAMIFAEMRRRGMDVAAVAEFAKQAIWEGRNKVLDNEILLFTVMHHGVHVVNGETEYAVVDGSMLQTTMYNEVDGKVEHLSELAESQFNTFNNINLFIKNDGEFETKDRVHDEDTARELQRILMEQFNRYSSFEKVFDVHSFDAVEFVDRIESGDYKQI